MQYPISFQRAVCIWAGGYSWRPSAGSIKVWDARQSEKPVAVLEPASQDTARDCWCVGFGNSYSKPERVVAAGYDNGDLKLFDLRCGRVFWFVFSIRYFVFKIIFEYQMKHESHKPECNPNFCGMRCPGFSDGYSTKKDGAMFLSL